MWAVELLNFSMTVGDGVKIFGFVFSPYYISRPCNVIPSPWPPIPLDARADRHLGPPSVGLRPPDPAVGIPTPGCDGQLLR